MNTYKQRLKDLWITAYEGGCYYWGCTNIRFGDSSKEQIKKIGSVSEYLFKRMWEDGREYSIFDVETGERLGVINKKNLKDGYTLLKSNYKDSHYKDLINDNWDAETSDVFLQLAVLKEITFG